MIFLDEKLILYSKCVPESCIMHHHHILLVLMGWALLRFIEMQVGRLSYHPE